MFWISAFVAGMAHQPVISDFARAAKVAADTITRFETGKGQPMRANLTVMRQTFEAAGIEFLSGDGVRLRRP